MVQLRVGKPRERFSPEVDYIGMLTVTLILGYFCNVLFRGYAKAAASGFSSKCLRAIKPEQRRDCRQNTSPPILLKDFALL